MMSLRESTLPQIAKTLRQNSNLPKELKSKVESMIKKAKQDVDDFYGEVTYRTERKREGRKRSKSKHPKIALEKVKGSRREISQESTTAASVQEQKKLDRLLRKRTLELGEHSDGDEDSESDQVNQEDQEEDESESVKMSSGDSDDDDEGKGNRNHKGKGEDTRETKNDLGGEDRDLFEGTRFSPGSQAGSGTPTPASTPTPRSGFDRTLQEMISKAVECGALASDACLHLQVVWGGVK